MDTSGKDSTVDKDDVEIAAFQSDTADTQAGSTGEQDRRGESDTLRKKIRRVIWDSLDKSSEERKFVQKVDIWIMTYVTVSYFVKYLDQTNVS